MHGLGNDFVIIDGRADGFVPSASFLKAVADRKRGVGCDQFVILRQPKDPQADVYMDMYNADASVVRACGNATRCVATLLFEEKNKKQATLETIAGLLQVQEAAGGLVSVDFGEPRLLWNEIPLAREKETLSVPLTVGGASNPCCVNMGNPHAVFFVPSVDDVPVAEWGARIETDALFPDRVNVEFAQILAPDRIRMRVWERGTGITQACGSGACATLVAAVRRGLSARRATIVLDGGELQIEWKADNGHVIMTGAAALSFRGVLDDQYFV